MEQDICVDLKTRFMILGYRNFLGPFRNANSPLFVPGTSGDSNPLAHALVQRLRPATLAAFAAAKKAAFTAGAEERRKRRDAALQKLDETSLRLQLFARALELFDGDASTGPVLHRHLLRTTATEAADALLMSEAEAGADEDGVQPEQTAGKRLVGAALGPGCEHVCSSLATEAALKQNVDPYMPSAPFSDCFWRLFVQDWLDLVSGQNRLSVHGFLPTGDALRAPVLPGSNALSPFVVL